MCGCAQGYLCGPCTRVLTDDLCIIAGLFGDVQFRTLLEELDVTITRTDKIGSMNVGSVTTGEREPQMMFNERASTARGYVERALLSARNEMWIAHEHLRRELHVNTIAAWLLTFKNLLIALPNINRIAADIRKAVTAAQRAIDRPVDRFYLGQCGGLDGDCEVDLYATADSDSTITCRLCGNEVDVRNRRWLLLRRLDKQVVTTKQVDGWEYPDGRVVRPATIRTWKARGLIRSVGKTPRKPHADLFVMGDITDNMLRSSGETD